MNFGEILSAVHAIVEAVEQLKAAAKPKPKAKTKPKQAPAKSAVTRTGDSTAPPK